MKTKLEKIDPKPTADLHFVQDEINLSCEYCGIWLWYIGDPQGESPLWPCECESVVCLK